MEATLQQPHLRLQRRKRTGYTYDRDALGRTLAVEARANATALAPVLASHAYTYNALGQRVREVTPQADLAYGYDQYRQVVSATDALAPAAYDFAYDYDPIGNRLRATLADPAAPGALTPATYTANSLNQYTGITTQVSGFSPRVHLPAHDANGNTRTEPGFFHTYDQQDRLAESIDSAQTRRVLHTYDGFGRRIERREQTRASTSENWTDTSLVRYLYDGWRVLEELAWDSSTSTFILNASYTRGVDLSGTPEGAGGIGGQLARVTPAETGPRVGSYVHDANGNVVALLAPDGTALARYRYSPFGETLSATGVWAQVNLYRFSAKEIDPFTGHYYYGFRYYNPSTGRWLSRDPIEEQGGLNLYGMVGNDPVDNIDPLGLMGAGAGRPFPGGSSNAFLNRPDRERAAWYAQARKTWLPIVKRESQSRCVPWRVVFTVLLNEYADYNYKDSANDAFAFGSVGIGQVTMQRAQEIGLTMPNGKPATMDYLTSDTGSISAVAQNLAANLAAMCADSSASFKRFRGCDTCEICTMSCQQKYDYNGKQMGCLIRALAAMHNSHKVNTATDSIWQDPNDPGKGNFPAAYAMGQFGFAIGLDQPWGQ